MHGVPKTYPPRFLFRSPKPTYVNALRSTGVGLSALKHFLATGRQCTALCRDPSEPPAIYTPDTTRNLKVVQANARNEAIIFQCLKTREGKLVDEIGYTIGGQVFLFKMSLNGPDKCKKDMSTLLETLAKRRREGFRSQPYLVVCSKTGI